MNTSEEVTHDSSVKPHLLQLCHLCSLVVLSSDLPVTTTASNIACTPLCSLTGFDTLVIAESPLTQLQTQAEPRERIPMANSVMC